MNGEDALAILAGPVTAVHQAQNPVAAALQGNVEMPGEAWLAGRQVDEFRGDVHWLDRADAQAGDRRLGQNLLQQPEEGDAAIEVAPIASQVDSRKHDFLVALILQSVYLLDDQVRSQAATAAANVRDDAERAARVAAVLDLQRGTRAVIGSMAGRDRHEVELVGDCSNEYLGAPAGGRRFRRSGFEPSLGVVMRANVRARGLGGGPARLDLRQPRDARRGPVALLR